MGCGKRSLKAITGCVWLLVSVLTRGHCRLRGTLHR
jgi:hypothetical protein